MGSGPDEAEPLSRVWLNATSRGVPVSAQMRRSFGTVAAGGMEAGARHGGPSQWHVQHYVLRTRRRCHAHAPRVSISVHRSATPPKKAARRSETQSASVHQVSRGSGSGTCACSAVTLASVNAVDTASLRRTPPASVTLWVMQRGSERCAQNWL